MATFHELLRQLKNKTFAPVYLLDGEEPYYIDHLIHAFENEILTPEERDFNLITLYGKETSWKDVINSARRFPMFAERMVVLLKDAGQMKDLNELVPYIEQPSPTTILVIEHRFKKIDKRGKLAKVLSQKALHFTSEKIRESDLPEWIRDFGLTMSLQIGVKDAEMLSVFLGNDLQKIANELQKIKINEPELQQLTDLHIEKYIGISREYNTFEFPDAVFSGDRAKLARMVRYFAQNPKAAPMPAVIGALYSYIDKVFLCYYAAEHFQNDRKLGVWAKHRKTARQYQLTQIHRCLALLSLYSCRAVGINNSQNDSALLQEMTARMEHILYIQ